MTITPMPCSRERRIDLAPDDRRGVGLAIGVGARAHPADVNAFFATPKRCEKFVTLYNDGWWYAGAAFRISEQSTTGFDLNLALAVAEERPRK